MRLICIHGHFYQPPREDPFTGQIPEEKGARPFRNWNERILAECYAPNARLGNFGRISFDVGPTLMSWLQLCGPSTYRRILFDDRMNVERHGVGNALAQAYNHSILPLAFPTDRQVQVHWGVADFEHRFGRRPQGMWLPETAVDIATLEILADHGISFTILAPWQAESEDLDVTVPYRIPLPSGRSVTVFFFQPILSGSVSFDPETTANADRFVQDALLPSFPPNDPGYDPLILVASDGELYGHHQPWRDKFLDHLLNSSSARADLTVTYPARYLKEHQVTDEVALRENTSWSCHHGLNRWCDDCDCCAADGSWKRYLRAGLDSLAAAFDELFDDLWQAHGVEPQLVRLDYVDVLLGKQSLPEFVQTHVPHPLNDFSLRRAGLMLDAFYLRQRMYTSCGFFFDDPSGLETRYNIAAAARVVDLVDQALGISLERHLLTSLRKVHSDKTGETGEDIYLDTLVAHGRR
jgi:alpha-amylase/alpha-mannosidase (GH57 family)